MAVTVVLPDGQIYAALDHSLPRSKRLCSLLNGNHQLH